MVCQLAQDTKAHLLNCNSTADQRPILLLEEFTERNSRVNTLDRIAQNNCPYTHFLVTFYFDLRDFPIAQMELPAMQETRV